MSYEKPKEMEIKVEVDRSAELEEKQREIDAIREENATLKADLEIIAEKEWKAKCEKYGLSGLDPSNQDDVKTLIYEEMKHKTPEKISYNTATLDYNQISGGLTELDRQRIKDALPTHFENQKTLELEANSEFELINELERRANNNNDKTAKVILAKLISKSKPFDMEFDGDPKDLYRKPKNDKDKAELTEKRQKWVRKE